MKILGSPIHRLLTAALLLAPAAARAGLLPDGAFSDDARGTTAAAFLKSPPAARIEALGGGGLAAPAPDSVFFNPAALAGLRGAYAVSGYESLLESAYRASLAVSIPGSGGTTWSAGAVFGSGGKLDLLDARGDYGGSFTHYDAALFVSAAFPLRDGGFGFSLKGIRSALGDVSALGAAVDLGYMSYSRRRDGADMALTLRNLGTPLKYEEESDPLPLELAAGLLWRYAGGFRLMADGRMPVDHAPYFIMGGEYGVPFGSAASFALRAGFSSKSLDDLGAAGSISGGFGLGLGAAAFDYAFVPYGDLGSTHRVTLSWLLGSASARSAGEPSAGRSTARTVVASFAGGGAGLVVSRQLEEQFSGFGAEIIPRSSSGFTDAERRLLTGQESPSYAELAALGRALGAARVAHGTVFFDENDGYRIEAVLVDSAGGKAVSSAVETAADGYALAGAARRLADKLLRGLP
ncbi:MAG: hypothetical protein FD189_2243 [Elusimicrobia bacterium]|nr:MAG: hypothetical protein FD154_1678 [Elusimicrobiota bacterium]KAF0153837.1 MAG: hypothetical protein FD189_2243 [Elusimicrobiota bacterium]